MTEENDEDLGWADDESSAQPEESEWDQNDPFFSMDQSFSWEDNEGNLHELFAQELPEEAELRVTGYSTPEEAADYINYIMTGASMFFEVVETEDHEYAVYYMGGSE